MHVHPRAVHPEDGLGHEGGVETLGLSDLLDREAVGHDLVGHGQDVLVAQVDLVLRRGHFVVGVLHLDAEGVQGVDGVAAQVAAGVERGQVEVPAVVEHLGAAAVLEVEELQFGTDVHGVAHGLGLGHHLLEHVAGIAGEGLAARACVISQNMRAVPPAPARQGSTAKVLGSGQATMSDSSMRAKPSIEEPSKPMPSSKAPSSSAGVTAKLLRKPSTSVNQKRMNLICFSSTMRRTSSLVSLLRHQLLLSR